MLCVCVEFHQSLQYITGPCRIHLSQCDIYQNDGVRHVCVTLGPFALIHVCVSVNV